MMTQYDYAIAEISLSGEVGLGNCSPSTVYRWAKIINEMLDREKCEWHVKPVIKSRSLVPIPLSK